MWEDIRLITLMYKELSANCQKQFKHIKRQFIKEEMQMNNKHMNRYSIPLVDKIINTSAMIESFLPFKMTTIIKINNTEC